MVIKMAKSNNKRMNFKLVNVDEIKEYFENKDKVANLNKSIKALKEEYIKLAKSEVSATERVTKTLEIDKKINEKQDEKSGLIELNNDLIINRFPEEIYKCYTYSMSFLNVDEKFSTTKTHSVVVNGKIVSNGSVTTTFEKSLREYLKDTLKNFNVLGTSHLDENELLVIIGANGSKDGKNLKCISERAFYENVMWYVLSKACNE